MKVLMHIGVRINTNHNNLGRGGRWTNRTAAALAELLDQVENQFLPNATLLSGLLSL